MNLVNSCIAVFGRAFRENDGWSLFLRYTILFLLIFLSLASISLFHIIATESNPFFYAKF
jgi:hypothetical protein